ncbi:MAG: hypothetical protein AAGA75_14530 [Cyanobacteria bacterium P01_E01_bin.6]
MLEVLERTLGSNNPDSLECKSQILQTLVRWADWATDGSTGEASLAAKRAVSIFFARARARAIDERQLFRAINLKRFIARTEALQSKIPSRDASSSQFKAFIDQVWQTWCERLELDPDLRTHTTNERQALVRYLDAHRLIVRCRKAAVRVSRKEWEKIEARMLTLRE